ncbi:MAG TPA: cell surface protein [Deinococcales bacterium]|nr:cell surface protein [Deinococcales bacterium]
MLTRLVPLLAVLVLGACAPAAERPSLRPVVFTATRGIDGPSAAAPGQEVVIQGRYLGGPSTGSVIFRADERGEGGTRAQAKDIVSWGADNIVVRVPEDTAAGGGFIVVEVQGVKSFGMPFSITEPAQAKGRAPAQPVQAPKVGARPHKPL